MSYDTVYNKKGQAHQCTEQVLQKLREIVPHGCSTREIDKVTYSKDYMPISLRWFIDGKLPAVPDCIVWPESTDQISRILSVASDEKIPVIPFGDGSGVLGGAIPVHGGIVVDIKKMDKIIDINDSDLLVTAETGINGMILERALNQKGYTLGHIPQSLYCSSLGGWIACKAAGQFSTKYGKIEDILVSLEAVLPNGKIISSKPVPRSSTGPAVERLLLGSEGRLGIVTKASLKIWPYPEKRVLSSFVFDTLNQSLEAVRKIMRKNVYPAVIRIYDKNETLRHFYEIDKAKEKIMLVLIMEGDSQLVKLEKTLSDQICKEEGGMYCGEKPVKHWLKTRFNVRESSDFTPRGFIFDTVEISVGWRHAQKLYPAMIEAMRSVKGVVVASAHASHFYPQGVCFYFTFGGIPPKKTDPFVFYESMWDRMMQTCIDHNGAISHHHGIGLIRGKWLSKEMQNRFDVLNDIKDTLDPNHIMNPGKMGEKP